jgi:hypothetical protein
MEVIRFQKTRPRIGRPVRRCLLRKPFYMKKVSGRATNRAAAYGAVARARHYEIYLSIACNEHIRLADQRKKRQEKP